MPNIPRNVNNFLNFPAEKSKTYANRYSFDRIFAEKSLNSVERYSDVSAAHGISTLRFPAGAQLQLRNTGKIIARDSG